VKAIMARSTSR